MFSKEIWITEQTEKFRPLATVKEETVWKVPSQPKLNNNDGSRRKRRVRNAYRKR